MQGAANRHMLVPLHVGRILQVALALAIAEDSLAFEHRDLHWGNVMLTPASSTYITCRYAPEAIAASCRLLSHVSALRYLLGQVAASLMSCIMKPVWGIVPDMHGTKRTSWQQLGMLVSLQQIQPALSMKHHAPSMHLWSPGALQAQAYFKLNMIIVQYDWLAFHHVLHCRFRDAVIKVRTEGAVVRLIDFTASRLQTPAGDIAFCNLEAEDGLFDGPKGKPQFETYRQA